MALTELTVTGLIDAFASSAPTPGGGSAAGIRVSESFMGFKVAVVGATGNVGREMLDILAERLNAIQVDAERVADCDGSLTVVAWGGSASTSEVLYQGQIRVLGASEIGRDRKIPAAVDAVMGDALEALRIVAILSSPAVPTAAQAVWERIGMPGAVADQRLPEAAAWGGYPGGLPVEKGDPLFPRR